MELAKGLVRNGYEMRTSMTEPVMIGNWPVVHPNIQTNKKRNNTNAFQYI
jgi:hypothetical protein